MVIKVNGILDRLYRPTGIIPLVVFRIAFGLMMFLATIRFVANGWVAEFYLKPTFHFTYYGFGWVKPLPGPWLYLVFAATALVSLFVAAGLLYRVSIISFFLLFTYIELLDKTYYLNHYYFISVLSLLMIFLPLNRHVSVDTLLWAHMNSRTVPAWSLMAVRLQLGLVYFFAGVAKLTSDWLFHALPLKIWLPNRTGFPIIGPLFDTLWVPFLMSWAGAIYDLTIPFLLLYRKTRPFAYLAVVIFHLMTAGLFHIGMFPWIMIVCTLVFFNEEDYQAALRFLRQLLSPVGKGWPRRSRVRAKSTLPTDALSPRTSVKSLGISLLALFFLIQLLLPVRHFFYPGDVHWTEEGYRYAWKVMLVEKTGHTIFHLKDLSRNQGWTVYPSQYLTPQQEKQMAFQPDMILEFAHYLKRQFRQQGFENIEVRAETYVSLNGRASRLLIDPSVDLAQQHSTIFHKDWILPAE